MPRSLHSILLPISFILIVGCTTDSVSDRPWTLSELEIDVADTSREVGYTNTRAGFYYTESNGYHRNSWQGWHVSSVKLLSDYRIILNGRTLDRTTSDYARVWPHMMTRSYHEGVQETFVLLDSIDAFVVSLDNVRSSSAGLSLLLDNSATPELASVSTPGMIIVSPFSTRQRQARGDVPGWVGVMAAEGMGQRAESMEHGAEGSMGKSEETGNLVGRVVQSVRDGAARFVVAAGHSPEEVEALLRTVAESADEMISQRSARMEALLNESFIRTSNERFDKALAWAKLSMDALVMEQGQKGIFAGLPWFSNYWGRDTFISLPGATLVTGRFGVAREILRSFAAWQNTDPRSADEGRIPNLVTPTSLSYNTADGTPWFVVALFDYVQSSGDTAFAREMYPVVRRAADGPLRHRTDRLGLLHHGEADTWMDAVGPEGPWSPRGSRANDIQALWYRQLLASAEIASILGYTEDSRKWGEASDKVYFSFRTMYIDENRALVADHLNDDGSADWSVRPNALFTFDLIPGTELKARVFKDLTESLVYPFGVGSLSPDDPNFHPYHHYQPYYVQDAAYHNGIVWTWLNGPWIEAAVRLRQPELAYTVTDGMVHQILERGAVGTISELLDAAPRPGESAPRLSGTFSQAWSLAEFLRTTYRSYLGVRVDATSRQVWLRPRLPKALEGATFDLSIGDESIRISYAGTSRVGRVTLTPRTLAEPVAVNVTWTLPKGQERSVHLSLPAQGSVEVSLASDNASAETSDGTLLPVDTQIQEVSRDSLLASCTLATPRLAAGLRSLLGPSYELLPHPTIKADPASAQILVSVEDPEGDDRGPGTYTYPSTTHLRPGSLDLTGFTVKSSDSLVHFELTFRALSNPGWHPEYGFQLTFAAIAIDTDGAAGSGRALVERNARYRLKRGGEYERIIFVGGGVQIEDAAGTILGAYMPRAGDERHPLGNAAQGVLSFSVPSRMLGTPSKHWRYTVLVGAQDDHGGAGLGEFRSVEKEGGEWIGGGKGRGDEANVYDVLEVR